ncbi:mitochondrial hypoxia responsive domain-containing protein [Thozetella sp. PMI_491]|nr:mitochondrial hypoxia responsive domain-containing protein [Thozetella sp. PMI_491]
MKVVSQEEQAAHYRENIKGGIVGGTVGLTVGLLGVLGASRRYPAFRGLTLPFRSFLVTSAGTFGAMVEAERWGIAYQKAKDPLSHYKDESRRLLELARRNEDSKKRFMEWGREHRYTIVFWSWVAAMGIALGAVGRNKYLTTSQKLVQARVYAQGLTIAVVLASAVFETADAKSGTGRWETVMIVDPNDPEHKHLIEKKIHKEDYEGQDLWKGKCQSPPITGHATIG